MEELNKAIAKRTPAMVEARLKALDIKPDAKQMQKLKIWLDEAIEEKNQTMVECLIKRLDVEPDAKQMETLKAWVYDAIVGRELPLAAFLVNALNIKLDDEQIKELLKRGREKIGDKMFEMLSKWDDENLDQSWVKVDMSSDSMRP